MTKPAQRGGRSPTRAQRSRAERARVWQGLARAQRSFAERARAAATRRLRRGQQSNGSAGQDGANRYAYAYNRPTTLIDPSGLFSFSFSGIANFFDSLFGGGDDDYSGLFSTPPLGAFEISGGRICFPSCNSETESSITNNPPPTSSPSEPPSSSGPMAPADPQTPSSADTTPSAPSANQSATAAGGDGQGNGTVPASSAADSFAPDQVCPKIPVPTAEQMQATISMIQNWAPGTGESEPSPGWGLVAGVEGSGSFGPGASYSKGYFFGFGTDTGSFKDTDVVGTAIPEAGLKVYAGFFTGSGPSYLDTDGFGGTLGCFGVNVVYGNGGWGMTFGAVWPPGANFEMTFDQGNLPLPQQFTPQ